MDSERRKYEGAYEEDDDAEDWESPVKKWKSFEKTILCQTYREEFGNDDAYEDLIVMTINC